MAVVEAGSFSGAAERLGVSNATVTRLVNDLEKFVEASLFYRTTRSMTLTETGAAYHHDLVKILPQLEDAIAQARGDAVKPQGTLTITASIMFGQIYVSPVIRQFLREYPDVSVNALFTDRPVSLIDEGVDLAIRIGHLEDSSMRAVRVGEVGWTACASPDYFTKREKPTYPFDLCMHETIAFLTASPKVIWHFDQQIKVELQPRLRQSTMPACIESALAGWGIVRALSYQVAPYRNKKQLECVLSEFEKPAVPVSVLHNDRSQGSATLRVFKGMLVENLRQESFG